MADEEVRFLHDMADETSAEVSSDPDEKCGPINGHTVHMDNCGQLFPVRSGPTDGGIYRSQMSLVQVFSSES